MPENIDLPLAIKHSEYEESMKILEIKLGELKRKTRQLKIPIIFVFEGWHASGLGEAINRFILPLDSRGYDFHTMTFACYGDELKPFLLHFWTLIPVRGKIAIFDQSWYSRAIVKHFMKEKSKYKLEKCQGKINCF